MRRGPIAEPYRHALAWPTGAALGPTDPYPSTFGLQNLAFFPTIASHRRMRRCDKIEQIFADVIIAPAPFDERRPAPLHLSGPCPNLRALPARCPTWIRHANLIFSTSSGSSGELLVPYTR